MDVPFAVRNPSALFDIRRLVIKCGLPSVETNKNSGVEQLSILVSSVGGKLNALGTDFYVCPFSRMFHFEPGTKIVSAKIQFSFTYYPFMRDDHGMPSTGESKIFTAGGSPLQWIEGEGLK